MLGCEFWHAFLADDEGSANPTTITGNVHAVVLCVHTDKLSDAASPPELTYHANKLQRHSVHAQDLAVQKDDAQGPARKRLSETSAFEYATNAHKAASQEGEAS